ncbi:MAG: TonB-dependent receptor plug domain-containing protein, partial [Haliea sp.]
MKQGKFPVGSGLLAGLLLVSTGVGAETDTPAQEEGSERSASLEEIIVTASRREINLQDLSMSVRALTQRQLEEVGAIDFYDYALLVPGLDYGTVGPGESRIIIRGVASNTGASTVGLYLDDLPVQSQGRNPEAQLFDVERVEVLRGPQGTLYGEGAMGGAIRVITNKANPNRFDASTEVSLFAIENSDTSYALNGMVNIPLVEDKLGLRLVGYYRDEDGYIDNVALGLDGVNSNKT